MRWDFVVHLVGGGYVRVHPGSARTNGAKPRYCPAPVGGAASSGGAPEHAAYAGGKGGGAPEHAAYEWLSPGDHGVFTMERASCVPQTDRMGKKRVWRILNGIAESIPTLDDAEGPTLDDAEGRGLDITNGTELLWWLWICNLGALSTEVIGVGVEHAWVAKFPRGGHFVFTFQRVDKTTTRVHLTGGHIEVEVHVE